MSNLQTLAFFATPEHQCSYLPDRKATTMFLDPKANVSDAIYNELSELGFRRSGTHYYRPHCEQCHACIPIRIPVADFCASRSQKRIKSKNRDLNCQILPADFHEDHYLLYQKYINERHADGDMFPPSREQYRSFLVEGHSSTVFIEYSLGKRLVAVAVSDQLKDGLSAIYTFFDPVFEHFSPGTFAILWQIEEAQRRQLPFVYLGYFIRQCKKMNYKTAFKPFQARINETWLSDGELKQIADHK